MNPRDLLLLDAIMSEGSITEAARKLGEPKATISRRLQRLEKAVGSPLFDRTSRRLRPTPLGLSLAGPAAAIRVALAGAQSVADAARGGNGGSLRIASPFIFGRLVLAPFVGRFIADHEDIKITLRFANELVDPLRDEFDIAIQTSEPKAPYLVRTKLGTADLKLYASPPIAASIKHASDLKTHKVIKTSNEVSNELILHLNDGHRTWQVELPVVCTVNDPAAACQIASTTTAVAALPEFIAKCFIASGDLMPILPNIRVGKVAIFAATPPGRLAVPRVRSFLTGLKKELADTRFMQS